MFKSRKRKRRLKYLESEIKRIKKLLKGYSKSLEKLNSEKDRLAKLDDLSRNELDIQYYLINNNITVTENNIISYEKLLKKLTIEYKELESTKWV